MPIIITKDSKNEKCIVLEIQFPNNDKKIRIQGNNNIASFFRGCLEYSKIDDNKADLAKKLNNKWVFHFIGEKELIHDFKVWIYEIFNIIPQKVEVDSDQYTYLDIVIFTDIYDIYIICKLLFETDSTVLGFNKLHDAYVEFKKELKEKINIMN